MQKLTDRQRAVLEYISESITDRGYPPTLREIGNHLGIKSTNGVNDHLRALERKGYLTREDMKSRTLRLVRRPVARMEARVERGQPLIAGRGTLDLELLVRADPLASIAGGHAAPDRALAKILIENPRDLVDLVELAHRE